MSELLNENANGHIPVLLNEVLEGLAIKPDGTYLDVTGGRGGHSAAILARLNDQGRLFITDRHEPAAKILTTRFKDDARVRVLHQRFSQVFSNLDYPFDGILGDLGISSPQLDDIDLGIGFQASEAPLDMRLDQTGETAADLLAEWAEDDLARIFYIYGGERGSRKIARAIVHDRSAKPFLKTGDLSGLCERVLGKFYRGRKIHPATKVFQALRIAVNDEMGELEAFLDKAPQSLAPGGRLAVISFHEGEDRPVKTAFRKLAQEDAFRLVVKKVITPSEAECAENPRARSAKLRVLERDVEASQNGSAARRL